MNFNIDIDAQGNGEMSWEKATDIQTNVWWSLNINQGFLFNNPTFGLDLSGIKKITVSNINLMKQRIESALQWLLDVKKATSIKVTVKRDIQDKNRINWVVRIIQADGIPITVTSFKTIG